ADDRGRELLRLGRSEAREALRYSVALRRSGRVAEGGALLRRYGAEWLHRGFESLLLRWRGGRAVECGGLENRYPSLGGSRVQIPPPPSVSPGEVSEWSKERDWKSRTC